jgi:hypothetical protein
MYSLGDNKGNQLGPAAMDAQGTGKDFEGVPVGKYRLSAGVKCLVTWGGVQKPLPLGGLGILDTKLFGQALRQRWLWLQFAEPDRPWAALTCPVDRTVVAFLEASTRVVLGNGRVGCAAELTGGSLVAP